MTAEQYILENFEVNHADKDIQEAMIGFAKYHVEQALKEAGEKAEMYKYNNGWRQSKANIKEVDCFNYKAAIDKDSILNAYPLQNIK
jgi:hypothetical protein